MSPKPTDNSAAIRALENLFDSLSPEDQQSFLARSSASSSPASDTMGMEQFTATQDDSEDNDQNSSPATASTTKPMAVRRRQLLKNQRKKKPLNAFIAYRSYYSPSLRDLTQKAKSGMLQKMWAAEQNKNKFSIIGQAYSELRDSDARASADKDFLKKFLLASVGLLQIIPVEDYLEAYGWSRKVDHDGEEVLERFGDASSLPKVSMSTNTSVQDIISHCKAIGLVASASASPSRNAGGQMAFAAAPMPDRLRTELWSSVESPAVYAQATVAEEVPAASTEAHNFDFSDYAPTIEQVTNSQQQAFDQIPIPMHFHPGIQPPILGFDPNMIQDDFDPYSFDVDQYLNFDFKI